MSESIKKIVLNLLNFLGKKWFLFHKAAKVLADSSWCNFFLRMKLFLVNKIKSKNYVLNNPIQLTEEIDKFKSRNFLQSINNKQCPTVAFTIVSKNYMQYALTLRESYLNKTPNSEFYIILMDMLRDKNELDLFLKLIDDGVKILGLYEVKNGIGNLNLEAMLFKYDILEMNTAIKPFFIEYFCNVGYQNVIYIDPDILFYNSLQPLIDKLEDHDIILTPHALSPYPDELNPNDLDILRAGSYNLGFIAVKNTPNTIKMCRWWQEKLFDLCINDLAKGLFVDQKWMDLVPSYFDKVYIERSPAYNIAYWNLHERKLIFDDNDWSTNNQNLVFFHFSGMPIDNIDCISKHQTRYSLKDFPELRPLFFDYQKRVLENGYHVFRKICNQYYFGYLPGTNIKIPDIIRRRWYKEILKEISNPYAASIDSVNTFIQKINEKKNGLNLVASVIYEKRLDLKEFFGTLEKSKNREAYLAWFSQGAKREYGIHDCFIHSSSCFLNDLEIFGKEKVGINLIGYFENIIGTAEAGRLMMKKLYSVGIPFSLFSFFSDAHAALPKEESAEFRNYYVKNPAFYKNIFFINADSIQGVKQHYPLLFKNHYNIAVWWWEFYDYFDFKEAFRCVDEVLVMTDFIKNAIEKAAPSQVKVTKITYPLIKNWVISLDKENIRQRYKIDKEDYVFYFNFDYFSSFERKNPVDLLKAFAKFAVNKKNTCLVLKTIHHQADVENAKIIENLLEKLEIKNKVILINSSLSRNELMSIVNACDCYVSLHRSEGLGLGLMEAMYLGKPVIGTAFGGNLDFMNQENSLLLDYDLVELKNDFGPYKKGWLWANPDIEQAVSYMEKVYNDREFSNNLGEIAAKSIREKYSISRFQKDIMEIVKR